MILEPTARGFWIISLSTPSQIPWLWPTQARNLRVDTCITFKTLKDSGGILIPVPDHESTHHCLFPSPAPLSSNPLPSTSRILPPNLATLPSITQVLVAVKVDDPMAIQVRFIWVNHPWIMCESPCHSDRQLSYRWFISGRFSSPVLGSISIWFICSCYDCNFSKPWTFQFTLHNAFLQIFR